MIKALIEQLVDNNEELYSVVGKVNSIDKNNRTCDVMPIGDEAMLYSVQLQPEQGATKGICCIPVIDSFVVVTFLNKNTAYVALCTEIESFEIVIQQNKFSLDKDGLLLQSLQGSLGAAFEGLASLLKQFKLLTNNGTTIAPTPETLVQIELFESKIKSLLK